MDSEAAEGAAGERKGECGVVLVWMGEEAREEAGEERGAMRCSVDDGPRNVACGIRGEW
jgi:hypothetical protein